MATTRNGATADDIPTVGAPERRGGEVIPGMQRQPDGSTKTVRWDADDFMTMLGIPAKIGRNDMTGNLATRFNSSATNLVTDNTDNGLIIINRTSASDYGRYRNGVSLGDATQTSATPDNREIWLGGANNSGTGFSTATIQAASIGGGLTSPQLTSLYSEVAGLVVDLAALAPP